MDYSFRLDDDDEGDDEAKRVRGGNILHLKRMDVEGGGCDVCYYGWNVIGGCRRLKMVVGVFGGWIGNG